MPTELYLRWADKMTGSLYLFPDEHFRRSVVDVIHRRWRMRRQRPLGASGRDRTTHRGDRGPGAGPGLLWRRRGRRPSPGLGQTPDDLRSGACPGRRKSYGGAHAVMGSKQLAADQAPQSDASPIGGRTGPTRHARSAGQSPRPRPDTTDRGDADTGRTSHRLPVAPSERVVGNIYLIRRVLLARKRFAGDTGVSPVPVVRVSAEFIAQLEPERNRLGDRRRGVRPQGSSGSPSMGAEHPGSVHQ
jgi:hypothetical protein